MEKLIKVFGSNGQLLGVIEGIRMLGLEAREVPDQSAELEAKGKLLEEAKAAIQRLLEENEELELNLHGVDLAEAFLAKLKEAGL